jgi:hypothetical protein
VGEKNLVIMGLLFRNEYGYITQIQTESLFYGKDHGVKISEWSLESLWKRTIWPLWDSCLETGMATIQKINTNFLVCPKDYYVKKLKDKLFGLSYGLLCKKAWRISHLELRLLWKSIMSIDR